MGYCLYCGRSALSVTKPGSPSAGQPVLVRTPRVGKLVLLIIFFQNRANWWALIPGFALLSLLVVIVLNWFFPDLQANWGGSVLLGGIGLSFFLIYLVEKANWWALIPGGVLLTLAATVGLEQFFPGLETVGIFFIGMGLTFGLVALLPNPQGEMRWAWIPAGILLFIGLVFMATTGELLKYICPVAFIFAGIFLLFLSLRSGRS